MAAIPTPSRDELVRLRESGLNREEIADYYGVPLSRVKRWISELKVPASTKAISVHARSRNKAEVIVSLGMDHGMTLIDKARLVLGKRMSEDYRGYLLDGRPCRVDVLIRAAGLQVPDVP